ncbi:hypothetical protein BGI30_03735 [Snodgrassella alvi]|jgi:hypothetical protein|uniref:hypothetical protein n=1 Tax=Snodgrassella alvi TaxID=1196083 RepID=UPI000C1EE73F|nr:hypothetical protein [Snodgrassella alvi]PIT14739.1 hypothetical protein BGI30_03735 [Snodgrassella alvi]
MTTFTKVILYTDSDGYARFKEEKIELNEGNEKSQLSPWLNAEGLQLRHSPIGFQSDFHCTDKPQWLFVLQGIMEIGLRDGSTRRFGPGEHFYSADTLPVGTTFDPNVHGHCSRLIGNDPLITAFIRN